MKKMLMSSHRDTETRDRRGGGGGGGQMGARCNSRGVAFQLGFV